MVSNTSKTYTMEQFVKLGKSSTVTYDGYSYKEILSNGTEISVLNVISDYIPEISEKAIIVEFTDEEYRKYRYRPKVLCQDLYEAPELYWVILRINGIIDIKDFNFKRIKILKKNNMDDLMSAIYNAEIKYIQHYNSEHGTL